MQAIVSFNNPNYAPTRWQGTLILYGVLVVTVLVNTIFIKFLPG